MEEINDDIKSVFGFFDLGKEKAESFFSLDSLFAKLVIGTESGRMGVKCV